MDQWIESLAFNLSFSFLTINSVAKDLIHHFIYHSILFSPMNKTLRHLNSSSWSKDPLPTLRKNSSCFFSSMFSVLVFQNCGLRAESLLANFTLNEPFEVMAQRHKQNHNFFKYETLRFSNQRPSPSKLLLEILSMNTTNRTGDEGVALSESKPHWERAWLRTKNADTFCSFIFMKTHLQSWYDALYHGNKVAVEEISQLGMN